jgi:hypothetical protein
MPGLDVEHWTGHTGCVFVVPHLVKVTKKEVGLPQWDAATERQQRDGMCWKEEGELYNNGGAFKLTCRDERGVIVTIIADNYFGYCKKEVKTQISYAANLFGTCEEEHAGGALVFPSYDLGEEFHGHLHAPRLGYNFSEVIEQYGDALDVQPEGHAIDKEFPNIVYVPEDVHFDLKAQTVCWETESGSTSIKLLQDKVYVRPSGYKVRMEKPAGGRAWRLVGTLAEGTLCHKPCTVSGGGKSEISKPITDAIIQGPVFVSDFDKDFDFVAQLINRNYSDRFSEEFQFSEEYHAKFHDRSDSRPILSNKRSLGSVIKLLTPASREFSADYNEWLESVPQYIKELVLVVKRFYKPEWGDNWREHFSVDVVNGVAGNELKCDGRKLVSAYLRVGFEADGSWRTFGLRKDFYPAAKWQFEDDITASVVVPSEVLKGLNSEYSQPAVKFVQNCEYRLFQRPDDAIHRGYDKVTEADFIKPDNFCPTGNLSRRPTRRHFTMMRCASTSGRRRCKTSFAKWPKRRTKLFRFLGASASGGWQAFKEPALFASAPRFAGAAGIVSARNGRAHASAHSARGAGLFAGQCRFARTAQQPAGAGRSRSGSFQPDSLHGTARTLHGVHLLDDR